MLKKPQLAFLILICTLDLSAQQPFKPTTYFGGNVSGSFCRVAFDPYIKQEMLATNSYGLVFRHISEPHIGIQVELNYAGRGWIENRELDGAYKRSLTVIDIPVTAAFIIGSKKLRFAFNLGPDVNYLLHEKETISIRDARYNADYYRFIHNDKVFPEYGNPLYYPYYEKPLAHLWTFGFTGGASLEWYSPIGAFGIRASYCYFLSDYFPLKDEIFYYSTSKQMTLNFGITYFVKLF